MAWPSGAREPTRSWAHAYAQLGLLFLLPLAGTPS